MKVELSLEEMGRLVNILDMAYANATAELDFIENGNESPFSKEECEKEIKMYASIQNRLINLITQIK